MPWPHFARLKPEDLNAVIAYLRTIPPIANEIRPPRLPGVAAYLWTKVRQKAVHRDPPAYVYPGNAGVAAERRAPVVPE
jgi:hypothetical protein